MTVDKHAEQHGEITSDLKGLRRDVSKLANGKTVDLVVKGAVAILGALELQSRTGIELGTAQEAPAAIVKMILAIIGG